MLIAIDFDETLTKDAELWSGFVELAQGLGHRVICVTARRSTGENIDTLDRWMNDHGFVLPIFFSSLGSKVEYMESLAMPVDVWIEDDPKRCALGH